jgi:hypothetical protein
MEILWNFRCHDTQSLIRKSCLRDKPPNCERTTEERRQANSREGITLSIFSALAAGQGAKPNEIGTAPHPEGGDQSVMDRNDQEPDAFGTFGITAMMARRTVFTDSGVVKTRETSESSATTTRSGSI